MTGNHVYRKMTGIGITCANCHKDMGAIYFYNHAEVAYRIYSCANYNNATEESLDTEVEAVKKKK
jgi:hypothetical protein